MNNLIDGVIQVASLHVCVCVCVYIHTYIYTYTYIHICIYTYTYIHTHIQRSYFWGECALTATYLINRTLSKLLKGKTLFDILLGTQPTYDHMKVFSSLCFACHRPKSKDKFASQSRNYIFAGYSYSNKGCKLYDLDNMNAY